MLVRIAPWVRDPPVSRVPVRFSERAERQLKSLFADDVDVDSRDTLVDNRGRRTRLEFFETYDELRATIEEILSHDTRSVYNRQQYRDGVARALQEPQFDVSNLAHYDPVER